MSVPEHVLPVDPGVELAAFRRDLRGCLTRRGNALFELGDAVLCAQGPVRSVAELSLEPEFTRGHGSAYDALACGAVDADRLRRLLAARVAPARTGEPLMFAVDTTALPRPDAAYAESRTMVQVRGKGGDVFLPGWSYSIVAGVGWGASSWVDPIEARRLAPGADHTTVTLDQVRGLLADLTACGRRAVGDPPPLMMFDAGYDPTALAHELAGEHVQILVRLSSKRVFRGDAAPRPAGKKGRSARHGHRLPLEPDSRRPPPDVERTASSDRYGTVQVRAWHGMHQALERVGHWAGWPADTALPIVRGTVIQVSVERLPGGRAPHRDIWLFHAAPPGVEPDLDLLWKAYLRRFDQEHFHRFAKVYLGLGAARLASAEGTDRWVALILAAYAQLRLASTMGCDLRRPWHPRPEPGVVLSPYRTRLGFRRLRARLGAPTQPATFSRPGPGRPKGSKNRPKAPSPPHRKTTKTDNCHRQ